MLEGGFNSAYYLIEIKRDNNEWEGRKERRKERKGREGREREWKGREERKGKEQLISKSKWGRNFFSMTLKNVAKIKIL